MKNVSVFNDGSAIQVMYAEEKVLVIENGLIELHKKFAQEALHNLLKALKGRILDEEVYADRVDFIISPALTSRFAPMAKGFVAGICGATAENFISKLS